MLWFCLTPFHIQSQMAFSPDFTTTDIDGNTYNLYEILESNRVVFLDLMTTWCGPCWNYHQSGVMHDFYAAFGPSGTNEVVVLMVEVDALTTMEDLMGTGSSTLGDWITGTNYPIVEDPEFAAFYQIFAVPTLLKICPDRSIETFDYNDSVEELANHIAGCQPFDELIPSPYFYADFRHGCVERTIQFTDYSWPTPDSWEWDFGDGATSTEQHPTHTYNTPGTYTVSLNASNTNGSNGFSANNYIHIYDGNALHPEQYVGATDKDIRPYEQKFCMQPECPFLPTLRHILAFVAKATRLRVFLG